MQNFKKRTPFKKKIYLPQNVDADIVDNLQKMADAMAVKLNLERERFEMATKIKIQLCLH
jgi:hypothetical protein